jgi:hypothetical protein
MKAATVGFSSQIATHVCLRIDHFGGSNGRRSLPPNLTKNTQLAIEKGKLMNRNVSNQKKDEDSRRRANPTILTPFATLRIEGETRSCD